MKTLFFTLAILLSCNCVWAQGKEAEPDISSADIPVAASKNFYADRFKEKPADDEAGFLKDAVSSVVEEKTEDFTDLKPEDFIDIKIELKRRAGASEFRKSNEGDAGVQGKKQFHWKPALTQSLIFLGLQQGARMNQEKTRRQLGGKFIREWFESVGTLRGWDDGNKFFTNYVAHPLQGGLTGRIFIQNSDNAKTQEFGKSKEYWESRLKAAAWSAFWSTQFEIGPISEASLGNVGKFTDNKHNLLSYVDLVVTPVGGTGVVIAEDAIDKYILKNWLEKGVTHRLPNRIKFLRVLLTPTTSVANLLRGRLPWVRDFRTN